MLVDVSGLDDGCGFRVEPIAREGAGKIVAAEHVALEAAVAALLLARLELIGVQLHRLNGCGIGNRQAEPGAEHDLFLGREVNGDEGCSGLVAEVGILKAGEEIRIEVTEACGGLGFRGFAGSGESLPDPVPGAAERVEGHGDVRLVALAFEDQFPVVTEAVNETDIEFHPAVRDVTGFDQVDDGEKHQRLVRRSTASLCTGDVEIGEFTEPGLSC